MTIKTRYTLGIGNMGLFIIALLTYFIASERGWKTIALVAKIYIIIVLAFFGISLALIALVLFLALIILALNKRRGAESRRARYDKGIRQNTSPTKDDEQREVINPEYSIDERE